MTKEFDLVVIGAGPGGYVAAIRAAQLGLKVAVVEREKALGGTCLRIGCIPSKALLESSEQFYHTQHELADHGVSVRSVKLDLDTMQGRKRKIVQTLAKGIEGLFKKNAISRLAGTGSFQDDGSVLVRSKTEETVLTAKYKLIATGSVPAALKGAPWEGELVGHSTHALAYQEVPKSLVVIGAGAIGLELGSVWGRLGAEVTVLEYLPRILPGMDAEIAAAAKQALEKQGIAFELGTEVQEVTTEKRGRATRCVVRVEGKNERRADRVLVAVGRKPCTDGLELGHIGVELDERGRIPVDEQFQTSAEGVFAIGDVIQGPMLAHKAEEEGIACVERLVTGHGHVNYDAIPSIVYTAPEVAGVGKTEEELEDVPGRSATPRASSRCSRTRRRTGSSASTSSAPRRAISSPRPPSRWSSTRPPRTWRARPTRTRRSPRRSRRRRSGSTAGRCTSDPMRHELTPCKDRPLPVLPDGSFGRCAVGDLLDDDAHVPRPHPAPESEAPPA
jgi:dihydrolipoamide dehydrogenase